MGDPVRFPLGICNQPTHCASILGRGTSLHPHLFLSTKPMSDAPCGSACPDIPFNSVEMFTTFTQQTAFGDDFALDIPELGGTAPGRSHLTGRFQVQFGPQSGDTVPFTLTSLPPECLLAAPPPSPLLFPGLAIGLVGQNEILRFPNFTYRRTKLAIVGEPFNFPHGELHLKTGRIFGEMMYPTFFSQKLLEVLLVQNDGCVALDSFPIVALKSVDPAVAPTMYVLFEKGINGQTVFRWSGAHVRSFATYRFPSPDYDKANSFIGGPKAELHIFTFFQAMHTAERPLARKTGAVNNVTSSIGEVFSYSYSIPFHSLQFVGSRFRIPIYQQQSWNLRGHVPDA